MRGFCFLPPPPPPLRGAASPGRADWGVRLTPAAPLRAQGQVPPDDGAVHWKLSSVRDARQTCVAPVSTQSHGGEQPAPSALRAHS